MDQQTTETDSSGRCTVTYSSLSPKSLRKTKESCACPDLPVVANPEPLLGTELVSSSVSTYELDDQIRYVTKIESRETHRAFLVVKEDVGSRTDVRQSLDFVSSHNVETLSGQSWRDVLLGTNWNGGFKEDTLLTNTETLAPKKTRSFGNVVSDHRDLLRSKHLGTVESARAFIKLVGAGRKSTRGEIEEVLSSKKNQKVL